MVSFGEARSIIAESIPKAPSEVVPLLEVHHRILAADVFSDVDIPPFDNSSMDGYAIRSEDTIGANDHQKAILNLAGEVSAGDVFQGSLQRGSAIRIMTGAPVPAGANAVLEQEAVLSANGSIQIGVEVSEGKNIRHKGEDIRRGDIVLKMGMRVSSAALGVLSSVGKPSIEVMKKPLVAFITTGNEVVEIEEPLLPGKIRNSNAYTLWGLLKESGCEPLKLGKVRDVEADLEQRIREGLSHDMLVTSGGVSVGKYDLVLETLKKLGVEILFWKVNIKPGMPVAFGMYKQPDAGRHVPVFALPGNPVSTIITFLQFVRPAIQKMMGLSIQPLTLQAVLEHPISKKDGKRHFSRGILRNENGKLFVSTTGSQSSGVLSSLVAANCLIIVREEQKELRVGDPVDVELL